MPPHLSPSNDTAPLTAREQFGVSLITLSPRGWAMNVAWDEAARCLLKNDDSGHDAAMRIFKALERGE